MSRSLHLYELQQIDSQLDQAQKRLDEIAKRLSDDSAVRVAESKIGQKQTVQDEARKTLNIAEANTKAQRLKIEQTENRLYSGNVKNPKELQDLQNESAALKRHLDIIEERQLEEMMVHDDAEAALNAATQNLDETKAKRIEGNAALSGEQTQLNASVAKLNAEREATLAPVSAKDVKIYEQLRNIGRGTAVAQAIGKSCGACGATISSSLYQAARSPSNLATCDTCRRIIYIG